MNDESEKHLAKEYAKWRRDAPSAVKNFDRLRKKQERDDVRYEIRARALKNNDASTGSPPPRIKHQNRQSKSRHRQQAEPAYPGFLNVYQEERWGDLIHYYIRDPFAAIDAQAVCIEAALEEFYEELHGGRLDDEIALLSAVGRLQYRMAPYTSVLFGPPERSPVETQRFTFSLLGFEANGKPPLHPTLLEPLCVPGHGFEGKVFDPLRIPRKTDGHRGRARRAIGVLFNRGDRWFPAASSRFTAAQRKKTKSPYGEEIGNTAPARGAKRRAQTGNFLFNPSENRAELTFVWLDYAPPLEPDFESSDRPPTLLLARPFEVGSMSYIDRILERSEPGALSWLGP